MIIERETQEVDKSSIQSLPIIINNIAGRYYTSLDTNTDSIVIFGLGAPLEPDSGHLTVAQQILDKGHDIFVPDYIGNGRSDGEFTPENCIKTFTQLFTDFTDGCEGTNTYHNLRKDLRYERVIVAGRSFAGTYIPVLPRFNHNIKELGVFYPVVDSKSQGTLEDETNELFLLGMKEDGYHHYYRGVLSPQWVSHLENEDDLSPMENIEHLADVKLFIGHGKNDSVVSYKKSRIYYDLLLKRFPEKDLDFVFALYSNGDHGVSTLVPATVDFLDWIG